VFKSQGAKLSFDIITFIISQVVELLKSKVTSIHPVCISSCLQATWLGSHETYVCQGYTSPESIYNITHYDIRDLEFDMNNIRDLEFDMNDIRDLEFDITFFEIDHTFYKWLIWWLV